MNPQTPIYLDYQASTPTDPRVLSLVAEVMAEDFANPHSEDHALGWQARASVDLARGRVAGAIGALPEEVIFTSGATEADNIAVLGAALGAPEARRRILVSAIEHKAVLEAAAAAERQGFHVERLPVTSSGVIDLDVLSQRLGPDIAVVSVMAVNNEIGVIQPVVEIAKRVAPTGAFLHTDATQAPAAMAVDVLSWNVDAASFSSHKVYGPKGVGALYLAPSAPWRPRPLMFGGGQEMGLRPGTLPVPLCAGFGLAMQILTTEGPSERDRISVLRNRFANALSDATSRVTCEAADRHPGCLHLRLVGVDAADLIARLQPELSASTGSACTSGVTGVSHVLTAVGFSELEAREGLRLSLGRFTTAEDVERAASLIMNTVREVQTRRAS